MTEEAINKRDSGSNNTKTSKQTVQAKNKNAEASFWYESLDSASTLRADGSWCGLANQVDFSVAIFSWVSQRLCVLVSVPVCVCASLCLSASLSQPGCASACLCLSVFHRVNT